MSHNGLIVYTYMYVQTCSVKLPFKKAYHNLKATMDHGVLSKHPWALELTSLHEEAICTHNANLENEGVVLTQRWVFTRDPTVLHGLEQVCSLSVSHFLRPQTMGFPVGVCENALRLHNSVQAAVEAILSETGVLIFMLVRIHMFRAF